MKKISLSLDECVHSAEFFINKNGLCILAYDVIGSGKLISVLGAERFSLDFAEMNSDLNIHFRKYLVNSEFNSKGLRDRFEIYRGDMASACVNSAEGVGEIIDFQRKNYVAIPLRWVVAENYWDEILKRI
jgi:hypothetical protein